MGVSGSGKTTTAEALAARLGWPFQEGDALHPPANIAKMAAGHPLTDDDRWPWLETIAEWAETRLAAGGSGIITCSALRRSYRDLIARRGSGVEFVYLSAPRTLVADRLLHRKGHYMPPALLDSQVATLEEPAADEPAIRVDVGRPPSVIVDDIVEALRLG